MLSHGKESEIPKEMKRKTLEIQLSPIISFHLFFQNHMHVFYVILKLVPFYSPRTKRLTTALKYGILK